MPRALCRGMVVFFLQLCAGHAVFGQQPPVVTVQPSSVSPGGSITINGTGFLSSSCGVSVYLDTPQSTPIGTAEVEPDGTFVLTASIASSTALGRHSILVQGAEQSDEFCAPSDDFAESSIIVSEVQGPFVSEPVSPSVFTEDLRNLPVVPAWRPGDPIVDIDEFRGIRPDSNDRPAARRLWNGSRLNALRTIPRSLRIERPSILQALVPLQFTMQLQNFAGILQGVWPPDTVGDVGPNHYIQMTNAVFAVYDKQGNLVAPNPATGAGASININEIWDMFGGVCETTNPGDPIVLYDPLADRWLLSQFGFDVDSAGDPIAPFFECIAISQTADPVTGGWFRYAFQMPAFPDYPKFGVWPDAYYMSTYEEANLGVFAFDRTNMLNGMPATFVRFTIGSIGTGRPRTRILPADLDGPTPPAVGAPNAFVRSVDGAMQGGGQDRLQVFDFSVNFANPGTSTFTGPTDVPTAAYDIQMCGAALPRSCIPQPNTTQGLDPLSNRLLQRLQYRNFGTHETLVTAQTVDVGDFSDHAGVRWYELRDSGAGWTINQQGTHAPDALHRWMPSAAMDRFGNMAVGYSVSDGTVFPAIRYAGRLVTDPLGTLPQGEATIMAGGGSQTGSARWGDYSAMSVDPVDDCTFWYTQEFIPAPNSAPDTRIASFKFPGCNLPPVCNGDGPYEAECGADVTLDGSGSSDPDGDPLSYTWNGMFTPSPATGAMPVVQFPMTGTSNVTLNVSDGQATTMCTSPATVEDTMPPVVPDDLTVECTSPNGTPVDLGEPTDLCDQNLTYTNDGLDLYPLGTTVVTWDVTDASNNTPVPPDDQQLVTVEDTTPPTLTVSASPDVLWPPNHGLRTIQVTITVSDVCDSTPTVRLVSITSSEADKDPTDIFDKANDIQGAVLGTDDRSFRLRAEHSKGGARTYTITYVAEDSNGNQTPPVQATVRVPKSGVDLISRNGHPANGASWRVAINTNGTFVAFSADATNLVRHDTNERRDVFVRDRELGTTERVSVTDGGGQSNGPSDAPSINGTGELVAFSSAATNLVVNDNNGRRDVFVRDRAANMTERVSLTSANTEVHGSSNAPSIDREGRFVAFQSTAADLVVGDTNGKSDIFVRDRLGQTTERLCDSTEGDRASIMPAISADGRYVAFTSAATNLVSGDTNARLDIFVCDRVAGTLERVSISSSGAQGNRDSLFPAISSDGRFVAFKSLASNLVPGDHNGLIDVFVRDRLAGSTERVSVDRFDGDPNDASYPPSISDDGRFVAFGSFASDLVSYDTNDVASVFVRDREFSTTYLVDVNDNGDLANRGVPDIAPAITGDGIQIGFISPATNLVADPNNEVNDVFIVCNPALPTAPSALLTTSSLRRHEAVARKKAVLIKRRDDLAAEKR